MDLPLGVLAVYAALAVWSVLLFRGLRQRSFGLFLIFGIGLLLLLNVRYLIDGVPDAIAFFIGIYDVLDNLGLSTGQGAPALASCPDNACTVWGDHYVQHPSWGVAFHDRFLNGPEFRTNLLLAHIVCNSIVFVLMHWQLARPDGQDGGAWHRVVGRTSFGILTLGTISAVWLASEHGPVGEYGGSLSAYGFYFMSFCVYGCAVMGVLAIRKGDAALHRIWMIRFAGAMWGAFWLFRVMLFVQGPLLRDFEAANILVCIWLSAPLGILIAEVVRRRILDRRALTAGTPLSGARVATG